MKTIKIMIAASEEMHDEKLEFTNLIEHLNEVLEPRDIELKRIKWDPETDGSIEEYKARLNECEMCLTLYWRDLAGNSEQELDTAYQELKGGNNPRNLYVFFKEPTEDLTEALKDFKANFVTRYGHFFCKFENVDTMNLHFILQLEAYQNRIHDDLVKVSNGKVMVGDEAVANLDKVPFASMNKDYQRLQKELIELDIQMANIDAQLAIDPQNNDLRAKLSISNNKRKLLMDTYNKYQKYLFDLALSFVSKSNIHYSERTALARELFESGDAAGADRILNLEDMKRETAFELDQFEQHRLNLEMKIEEFWVKAKLTMTNCDKNFKTRFEEANEAYEQSVMIARKLSYNKERFVDILSDYSLLLTNYHEYKSTLYETQTDIDNAIYALSDEELSIRRQLADDNSTDNLSKLASALVDTATKWATIESINMTDKTRSLYDEGITIFKQLATTAPNTYIPEIINALTKLANATYGKEDGLVAITEALKYSRQLVLIRSKENLTCLVDTLLELAYFQVEMSDMGNAHKHLITIDMVISNIEEALTICHQNVEKYPEKFRQRLAKALFFLGNMRYKKGQYDTAMERYQESLSIYRCLAKEAPNPHLGNLAKRLRIYAIRHEDLQHYIEAQEAYQEFEKVRKQLAAMNIIPPEYLPDSFFHSMESFYKEHAEELDNFQAAKEQYQNYQQLITSGDNTCLCDYAASAWNYSQILMELNHHDEALSVCQESLNAYRTLALHDPETYNVKLAKVIEERGRIYTIINQYDRAEDDFKEVLSIYQGLADTDIENYYNGVFWTSWQLAIVYFSLGHYTDAIGAYGKMLVFCREMQEKHIGNLRNIALTLQYMGLNQERCELYTESLKSYTESLALFRQLAESGQGDTKSDLAEILVFLGNYYYSLHQYQEALPYYVEAKSLYNKAEKDTWEKFAEIYEKTARIYEWQKSYKNAAKEYYDGWMIYTSLFLLSGTSNKEWQEKRAEMGRMAGYYYYRTKEYEDANIVLCDALNDFKELFHTYGGKIIPQISFCLKYLSYITKKLGQEQESWEYNKEMWSFGLKLWKFAIRKRLKKVAYFFANIFINRKQNEKD